MLTARCSFIEVTVLGKRRGSDFHKLHSKLQFCIRSAGMNSLCLCSSLEHLLYIYCEAGTVIVQSGPRKSSPPSVLHVSMLMY